MFPAIRVALVGCGFMGTNICKNLNQMDGVKIAYIVDLDQQRLEQHSGVRTYKSLSDALADDTAVDIYCVATWTKTHAVVIKMIADMAAKSDRKIGLFLEKPLVADVEECEETLSVLKRAGFGAQRPVTCDYLFRESPAVQKAIQHIQDKQLSVSKMDFRWQKDREAKGPPRPTAGVHADESTHLIDLALYVVKRLSKGNVELTIADAVTKSQSQVGKKIAPDKLQQTLYADEPEKWDPLAECDFNMTVGQVPVHIFSSFAQGPQKREMTITCSDGSTLLLEFDVDGADRVRIEGTTQAFACNKLQTKLQNFVNFYRTGVEPDNNPSLEDMTVDVRATTALAGKAFPIKIL